MSKVSRVNIWLRRLAALFCILTLWAGVSGCEDDNHEFGDYVPAAGQGALGIDNQTASDLVVYSDGDRIARVTDGNNAIVDSRPGTHRIVLDDEDNDRSWVGVVDVLAGQVTVLRVRTELDLDYDVEIDYE
jgi:hypothetical protein